MDTKRDTKQVPEDDQRGLTAPPWLVERLTAKTVWLVDDGGALLDAGAVEREWSGILSGIRARMLSVPSRAAQRLPQLDAHAVAELDREVRDALTEAGETDR